MTLSDLTHGYWLLSLQDRRRLDYYKLSREDQARVVFPWSLRRELLDALPMMPPHLAERVICEARSW